MPIDALDHKILRALSREPLMTLSQLSRKAGTPISTVEYRLKSLKDHGVIVGYQYLANDELIGRSSFPVALYLRRNTAELQKKLIDFCLSSPNIPIWPF